MLSADDDLGTAACLQQAVNTFRRNNSNLLSGLVAKTSAVVPPHQVHLCCLLQLSTQ